MIADVVTSKVDVCGIPVEDVPKDEQVSRIHLPAMNHRANVISPCGTRGRITRLIADVVTGKVDVRGIPVVDEALKNLVDEMDRGLLNGCH